MLPQPVGECWEWEGKVSGSGYAHIRIGGGNHVYLHRHLYEQEVGPISEGLEPDHLCNNTRCVNWNHLEPVTRQENLLRRYQRRPLPTHCRRGHEFTPENTYTTLTQRSCRTCKAEVKRAYKRREREKQRALSNG